MEKKRRRVHGIDSLPYDCVYEICRFLKEPVDFLNFRRINKNMFNFLSMDEYRSNAEHVVFCCGLGKVPWKVVNGKIELFHYVVDIRFNVNEDPKHIERVLTVHKGIRSADIRSSLVTESNMGRIKRIRHIKSLKILSSYISTEEDNLDKVTLVEVVVRRPLNFFSLRSLSRISHFELTNNLFKEDWAERIFSCIKNVTHLNVSGGVNITDAALMELKGIVKINLSGCKCLSTDKASFTSKSLKHIRDLGTTKSINISKNGWLEYDAFMCINGIGSVNISDCTQVDDNVFKELSNVKHLKADGCYNITDKALGYITGVKSLSVSMCRKLTSAGINKLTNVKKIIVSYCDFIDSKLLANTKGPLFVDVTGCGSLMNSQKSITYKLFESVDCNYLHTVILNNCLCVTDKALWFLSRVEVLDISGCVNTTGSGLKYLKRIRRLDISSLHITNPAFLKPLTGIFCIIMRSTAGLCDQVLSYFKHSHRVVIESALTIEGLSVFTWRGIMQLKNVPHLRLIYASLPLKCLNMLNCKHVRLEHCMYLDSGDPTMLHYDVYYNGNKRSDVKGSFWAPFNTKSLNIFKLLDEETTWD